MKKWNYIFGVPLADTIVDKLEACDLMRSITPHAKMDGFEKDAFSLDGYPVAVQPYTVYPALLYRAIGIPISESVLNMQEGFRRTASEAAVKWLEKVTGSGPVHWEHNGLTFLYEWNGEELEFCFPDTSIQAADSSGNHLYAVLPFPDVKDNDSDWEKGMIPQYAELQAQLMLWCSKAYAEINPDYQAAEKALLCRVKGILPVDYTIRTVTYNEKKAHQILDRIARAYANCQITGNTLLDNLRTIPATDWREEKQLDLDNAYRIDSEELYNLLGSYMRIRSTRKKLEAQAEEIKNQMAAICFTLASRIGQGFSRGEAENSGTVYSVVHTPRRKTAQRIPADLVRQLAPEYSSVISVNSTPRGRIEIEVL